MAGARSLGVAARALLVVAVSLGLAVRGLPRAECRQIMTYYADRQQFLHVDRRCNLPAVKRSARALCRRGFCDPPNVVFFLDCFAAADLAARLPQIYNANCEPDLDRDGFGASVDCDDTDPAVNPRALDLPFDAVDADCDGLAFPDTVRSADIQVSLVWDFTYQTYFYLAVTDPTGRVISRVQRDSPRAGGVFDRVEPACRRRGRFCCPSSDNGIYPAKVGLHNILYGSTFPGRLRQGTYRITVKIANDCLFETPAWNIRVAVAGQVVLEKKGSLDDFWRPASADPRPQVVDTITFDYEK